MKYKNDMHVLAALQMPLILDFLDFELSKLRFQGHNLFHEFLK